MGLSGPEKQRLLGSLEPESTVDEEVRTAVKNVVWARRVRRRFPTLTRSHSWRYVFCAVVVLVVIMVSLVSKFSSRPHIEEGNTTTRWPFALIEQSDAHPNGLDESFSPSYCQGERHRYHEQVVSLGFQKAKNLTFQEILYGNPGPVPVDVGGQIDVRRLNKGDGGDPRMVLEIVTNKPDLELFASFDTDGQVVRVEIPERSEDFAPGQRPCVEIKGTIWVPQNAQLGVLNLDVIHLNILLFDDLSLHVADHAKFTSLVGDITAGVSKPFSYKNNKPFLQTSTDIVWESAKDSFLLDSRIIVVYTTSGSIEGNWPLYDVLSLHALFGETNVSITPKDELESNPKPASLMLSSISGSIAAAQPVQNVSLIPRRDYVVDVKSTTGKIHAALAIGAETTIQTTSSDMILDLLPVINIDKHNPRNRARLETNTQSGATSMQILEPLFFDNNGALAGIALDCLDATHWSTSGNIDLQYPQSWEGMLYAKTTSGKLTAKGKDLKIITFVVGWPGTRMQARKGAKGRKSLIKVQTVVGTVNMLIGDEGESVMI